MHQLCCKSMGLKSTGVRQQKYLEHRDYPRVLECSIAKGGEATHELAGLECSYCSISRYGMHKSMDTERLVQYAQSYRVKKFYAIAIGCARL